MGDIADEIVDSMIEHAMWFPTRRRHRRFVSCKNCGAGRLEWAYRSGKWILVRPKGQKAHECDPDRVNAKITDLLDDDEG